VTGEVTGIAGILHADLDSFYASVEQRDDPALRDRPMAVGAGVILAASYEAKRLGVRTASSEQVARRACPDLVVVPPRFAAYTEASGAVFDIFHDTTPLVEGISIDEAFLDVRGLRRAVGPPVAIAERLRQRVAAEVGLPITVGVARTKFLAKVASAVAKPDGLLVVEPEREVAFLHPLPVERLWGVGRVTTAKLNERGLYTVGDIAAIDRSALCAIVGAAAGRHLHALANNEDPRAVEGGKRRKSIGAQQALGRRSRSRDDVLVVLQQLVDRVTGRMRKAERVGLTVVLRVRFGDFSAITRSHTLPEPTSSTSAVSAVARSLFDDVWPSIEERGISLIGVSVGNLTDVGEAGDAVQLAMTFTRAESDGLDDVIDEVRKRFGSTALTRAASIGSDPGIVMPLLPD
jgi:DNA polymerase-4